MPDLETVSAADDVDGAAPSERSPRRRSVLGALGLAGLGAAGAAAGMRWPDDPARAPSATADTPPLEGSRPLSPASGAARPTVPVGGAAARARTATDPVPAGTAGARPTSPTSPATPATPATPGGPATPSTPAAPATTDAVGVPADLERRAAARAAHEAEAERALEAATRQAHAAQQALLADPTPVPPSSTALVLPVSGWTRRRQPLPASATGWGFAAVAATTTPTRPVVFDSDPGRHLLRRATFGARPADVAALDRLGIDGWIATQLEPARLDDPDGEAAWALYPLASASPTTVHASIERYAWDAMRDTAFATLARQIFSSRQLFEQVVDVMGDHLHVAIPGEVWDTGPSWMTDVVRPGAMGRYRDLLKAAMRHPAMLVYLNNDVSTKRLVNENLGRELLELHTVGLGAGYSETDVVMSAKILTGRSVADGAFVYRADDHWTGAVRVLDFAHPNTLAAEGLAVGDAYLDYLAGHEQTALRIAGKLAVRFVGDRPPTALVERMARAYLDHDTDVTAVLETLFRSPEFWASTGQRSRRPLEDVVGGARILDMRLGPDPRPTIETLYWVVGQNGHAPLAWPPPNGYPDVAAAWNTAGNLVNRWTMHRGLTNRWWASGMVQASPTELVDMPAGMTAAQWVDALSVRLLGQTMTTARRDAVVRFAGLAPTDPAVRAAWQAWGVVPLLLDSPYFHLR